MYVTTGFSLPYVAKYANSGNTVTYSGLMRLGRGVSMSLDITVADDNDFYADDVIAESDKSRFTSGSATITVDGLDEDAATLILGLPEPTDLTVDGNTVKMQGYGDALNPPEVGYGCIRQVMYKGTVGYIPIILPKITFSLPSDDITTRGAEINWQTQELSATIQRDDTVAQNWKVVGEKQTTRAAAEAVLTAFLGGTATTPARAEAKNTVKEG